MFDDDAAGRALRTLTDEPAPPIATTFDEVLRRGRRRVFAQRVGAVAGVVAVVGAIGVGAVLLRPGDPSGDGVRVGGTNPATAPESTSTTSQPVLPSGWGPVKMPTDVDPSVDGCMQNTELEQAKAGVSLLPEGVVVSAFTSAVELTLGTLPKSVTPDWNPKRGKVAVEVPMNGGLGQLWVETEGYGGTPRAAAEATVMVEGNCEAPYRRVLADGTVLQLYPTNDYAPEHPTRTVRVFGLGGHMYTITSAGYSKADIVQGEGTSAGKVVGGRGALPTTPEQLATIAERLATSLG